MKWRQFVFTQLFWKHLLLAFAVMVILFWIVIQILRVYTRQGDNLLLPDFVGQSVDELVQYAEDNDLEVIIMDSVYEPNKEKGTILLQDPLANTNIKHGRKVYVSVVGQTPEKVKMPNLIDLSVRQAVDKLMAAKLQVERIQLVPGEYTNAVVDQTYKGSHIKTGAMINRCSKIVLVVERGSSPGAIRVPDVSGMSAYEAYRTIYSATLNVGRIKFEDGFDDDHSKVVKQSPQAGGFCSPGDDVDLWFKLDDSQN